jgi:hypothetical protein
MDCNDQGICPGPFFKPTIDWKLEDPKGKPIEKVREIRDDIERRVQKLIIDESQARALLFSVLFLFEVFIFVRFFLFFKHRLDSPPLSSKFNSSSSGLKYLARAM